MCLLPIEHRTQKLEYKGHFMERDGTYFNNGDQRLSQINDEYAFHNQNKQRVYRGDGLQNRIELTPLNSGDLGRVLIYGPKLISQWKQAKSLANRQIVKWGKSHTIERLRFVEEKDRQLEIVLLIEGARKIEAVAGRWRGFEPVIFTM